MKSKQTRRALVMSLLSLLLCMSMLVGTTFAWFTDSVTSGVNQIVAGNLDIDVFYDDEGTKTSILNATTLFNDVTLWEPGAVAYETLTVENLGTLALKYQMAVSFTGENTVEGKGLSDILLVGMIGEAVPAKTAREDVIKMVDDDGTWTSMSDFVVASELDINDPADIYTLVIYWEPSAEDNDFNVNNGKETSDGKALHIDLGIRVDATQLTAESDSFDSTYDAGAYLPIVYSAEELTNALQAGDGARLGANITLTEAIVIPDNATAQVLDLNGCELNTEEESAGRHLYALMNYGVLTIADSANQGEINSRGIYNYGKLTLESGSINAIDGNGGYAVWNQPNSTFVMNGGTVAATYEDDNLVDLGGYDATAVRVEAGATFTMNDGVINNVSDFTFAIDNSGTTTVKNGQFTSVHTTVRNNGTMTIEGGSFTCVGVDGETQHVIWAEAGTMTITGGTFDGKDTYNGFNVVASSGATVNISGGNFLPVHSGSFHGDGTISVTGGTFFDDPTDRVATDYDVIHNVNGTYSVYGADSTLKMADGATLDLGGQKFPGTIVAEGDLTIVGDTTIKTLTATKGGTITIEDGKTLTLNNFSFGSGSNPGQTYEITGGTVKASYGFFQHGTYELYSDFETGYMYYSFGSNINVYGTFHSQGKGDGLDYIRGNVTIKAGGESIHEKSLWVGQPASWGAMTASLTVEEGGKVQANSLSVYAGSSLLVDATNATAGAVSNIVCNSLTVQGTIEAINNGALTAKVDGNKIVLE